MSNDQQTIRGMRDLQPIGPRQEMFIRVIALAALAYGVYWLHWRWTETLNPDSMTFSLILVIAETWGFIGSCFFLMHAWQVRDREPPPAPEGRTVDVFITCYNEPLEILRRTVIGARAIRYPHRTYILDDGKREEVLQLAKELGVGYIRRVGSVHAKAGNLNHAISVTSGEFILQLDTDHVPMPSIVDRMIGYFDDPKVGFTGSPQDFYNTDSFTHVVNEESRSAWEENRIFYSLLQPGKDYWNASFFCGSSGMLRRAALEEIGGFSTETIIEDMETSIKLHSKGWKSVYHTEPLAFGLAPASAVSFHVQRLRWAQGSMQMLKKFNPLFVPGLAPAQRACYFAANVYPIDGIQKIIFYLTPVMFLMFGMVPLVAPTEGLLWRLGIYLVLSIGAFEMVARGTGWLFIQERYNMAKCFTYAQALAGFFARGKLDFVVTPKGATDVPFRLYAPQLFLAIVSAFALIWAPIAYARGWIYYPVESMALAFAMSGAWLLWNIYFAWSVVNLCLKAKQQRGDHRFVDQVPIRIRPTAVEDATPQLALTRDLNPMGLAFRTTTPVALNEKIDITMPLSTRTVDVRGEVVHVQAVDTLHGEVFVHGVKFDDLAVDDRDAIELHCTQHAIPVWRSRYRQNMSMLPRAFEVIRNARGSTRREIQLPALLTTVTEDGTRVDHEGGLLEEISRDGARLLLDHEPAPGTRIHYEVPGTNLSGTGQVVFTRLLESPMCVRYTVGLRLEHARSLKELVVPRNSKPVMRADIIVRESHEQTPPAA